MAFYATLRKLFLLVVSLLFFALPITAEVLFLVDGEILIGDFVNPNPEGFLYKTYKGDVVIPVGDLIKSEKSISVLASIPVELVLKDNSIIKGKIVDFDYDIGIFIDISFGTLTIPNTAVSKIVDPIQRSKFSGSSFQYGVSGGMYFPLGTNTQYFGPSWLASVSLQSRIPGIRGLFAGASLAFNDTSFIQVASTKYYLLSVCPELSFKLLDWRTKGSFLGIFSPFAAVGAGLAYINVSDPLLYPPSYGNLTLRSYLKAGTEIAILPFLSVEVAGHIDIFVQGEQPFYTAGATLGVSFNQ